MDACQMQNTRDIVKHLKRKKKKTATCGPELEDVSRQEEKERSVTRKKTAHLSIDHCESVLCLWIEASHNKVRSMRVCGW